MKGEGVETPKGSRTGEMRSIYLKRSDFEKYGHTDGCPGCQDMATQRPGPSSGWAAHTSACRKRMEEKIQRNEPRRWEMYVTKRRGNGDADPDAEPTPTGGAATGGPASSTQTAKNPPHERGSKDHTSDTGTTSTGDPVTGGLASSTQRTRGPPQERDDPKDDDAD